MRQQRNSTVVLQVERIKIRMVVVKKLHVLARPFNKYTAHICPCWPIINQTYSDLIIKNETFATKENVRKQLKHGFIKRTFKN